MFRTKTDKEDADFFFKNFASMNGFDQFCSIWDKMSEHELQMLQELAIASLTSEDARSGALIAKGRYQFMQEFLQYLKNIKRSVTK